MSGRVELWVRLKVVDLVAQTAWITLTEKLDFAGRIRGLTRYSYWDFSADGPDGGTIADEIDRVVRMDSAFTNQNKHVYRLMVWKQDDTGSGAEGTSGRRGIVSPPEPALVRGDLPLERDYELRSGPETPESEGARGIGGASGADAGLYAVDCLIRERHGDREAAFAARLNARLRGVRVSDLKAGELWRVVVSVHTGEGALETVERMAVTRSRREGLLLNPHYQTVELLSTRRLSL